MLHFHLYPFTEQQAVEQVGGSHYGTDPTGSTWDDLSGHSLDAPCCAVCFTLGEQNTSRDLQSHTVEELIIQSKISTYRVFLAHLRICSYSCGGLVSTTNLCMYLLEQTKEMFLYSARHSPTGFCRTMQPPALAPSLPTLSHGSILWGKELRCRQWDWVCTECTSGKVPSSSLLLVLGGWSQPSSWPLWLQALFSSSREQQRPQMAGTVEPLI